MNTVDFSYANSSLTNPDRISYTTDGKNQIKDATNSYAHEYYGKFVPGAPATDVGKVTTEIFKVALNPQAHIFDDVFFQHTMKQESDGVLHNWHLRFSYKSKNDEQKNEIVKLFNNIPGGGNQRPDGSGKVLHLNPEITQRDRDFFINGDYQTKYKLGVRLALEALEQQHIIQAGETERLLSIPQEDNS